MRYKGLAIDLFRIWDEDESGYIDKNEFGKALVALGFVANREDLNTVFDMLDEDGSGQIDYNELNKMLKKGAGSAAAAAKKERPRSASPQDEKAPVKKTDQPGPAKRKNDKKP
jgi:Ca2+-binding EF-hand superfamily protein